MATRIKNHQHSIPELFCVYPRKDVHKDWKALVDICHERHVAINALFNSIVPALVYGLRQTNIAEIQFAGPLKVIIK